jgi:cobalt-zinc-cadmium efflux system outer membrane protein
MVFVRAWCAVTCALFTGAALAQTISLADALALGAQHPQQQAAQAGIEQAQGDVQTATQYPNPSVEMITESYDRHGVALAFPLETPAVRNYRLAGAQSGLLSAEQQAQWTKRLINADIEQAFYRIVQAQQLLQLAEEEVMLLAKLHHAVQLKVQIGESPRYELVKSEAEWLTSKSKMEQAEQAYTLARQQLADRLALTELPIITASLPDDRHCLLTTNAQTALSGHPVLLSAQAQLDKDRATVGYEQSLVSPQPTVMIGTEHEPGMDRIKMGLSLPLPLWHQRDGQIASAQAKAKQSQAQLDALNLVLKQQWSQAVSRYRSATSQLTSYESGLLKEANNAFQVAQAAYKYGERGILDYIDAQRTLASVKQTYVNTQFERHYACIDIEQFMPGKVENQ